MTRDRLSADAMCRLPLLPGSARLLMLLPPSSPTPAAAAASAAWVRAARMAALTAGSRILTTWCTWGESWRNLGGATGVQDG
eukprot:349773-Chlamydomonas_euryale.AAC.2